MRLKTLQSASFKQYSISPGECNTHSTGATCCSICSNSVSRAAHLSHAEVPEIYMARQHVPALNRRQLSELGSATVLATCKQGVQKFPHIKCLGLSVLIKPDEFVLLVATSVSLTAMHDCSPHLLFRLCLLLLCPQQREQRAETIISAYLVIFEKKLVNRKGLTVHSTVQIEKYDTVLILLKIGSSRAGMQVIQAAASFTARTAG